MRSPERAPTPPAPAARPISDVVLPSSPPYRPAPAVIPAAPRPLAPNGGGANAKNHSEPSASRQNSSSSLDETLLRELEVTFEPSGPRLPVKPPELTLDEEMTKLLGELSSHKRS
jgi:hypothetical protein